MPQVGVNSAPVNERTITLREAPVCNGAVEKLRSEGYKVACEIPVGFGGRNCDAAATKDGKTLILEAKVSFTHGLRCQLNSAESSADFIVGAVAKMPSAKSLEWARMRGYGVWIWSGTEIVEVIAPQQSNHIFAPYREKLIRRIDVFSDGVTGGKPNMKGVGPAQECQRAVDEYRSRFPAATWAQIYANVPSHYDNAKNMYSALRSNAERIAIRARLKARKAEIAKEAN